MDYGQNPKTPINEANQPFFTAGAGTNSEPVSPVDPENNLDTSNQNWEGPAVESQRNIGNLAISSSENTGESPAELEQEGSPEQLGQIVYTEPPAKETESVQDRNNFNETSIKIGERLEKSGIKMVDDAIAELNQTGDASKCDDTIRYGALSIVKNSYGEQANWKGHAA